MRNVLLSLLLVASSSVLAGPLDGLTFCRNVSTGGMFGQPTGIRKHCVSFENDRAHDNADTFFGKPPKIFNYSMVGDSVFNLDEGKDSGYTLIDGNLVVTETSAVLVKQSPEN